MNTQLIAYLEANQGSATYLVGVPTSNESAPIIISTGKAVMTLGGFNGSDPILTSSQLQTLIKDGAVRYFLLSGNGSQGGGPGGGQATSDVTAWVTQNCATVSASAYGGNTIGSSGLGGPGGGAGGGTLYDCSAAA